MKGELGPYAQAVAKYQVEQKLRRMYEKYKKNNSNKMLKEDENNKQNDEKVKASYISLL